MFSGFFGKDDKSAKTPTKEALDSRGLEIIEDDPETTWSLWDNALAEHATRHRNASDLLRRGADVYVNVDERNAEQISAVRNV